MTQNKMLKGLPSIIYPNQLCGGCLVGNHIARAFLKSLHQEQGTPYKKYISMFVIVSNHIYLVKIYIFYFY